MNHLKNKIERNYIYKIMFGITFIIYLSLDLYVIRILQRLIDSATEMNMNKFYKDIRIFIVVLLITVLFILLEQFFLRKITNYGSMNLKKYTFKSFLNKRSYYENKNNAGKIVSQINSDIPIIANWVSSGFTITIIQLMILITCITILFIYSTVIALFIFLIILIAFIFARFVSFKISKNMKVFQKMIEEVNEKSYEGLRSISIIKQLDKNKYFCDDISKISREKYYSLIENLSKYRALENSELNFLADVLPLCTFVIAIILTTLGRLTIGSAFAIMLITQKLNEPIIVLAERLTERKIASKVYDRIKSLYVNEMDKEKIGKLQTPCFKELEIDLYEYRYPNKDDIVLNNVKINIIKGDIVILRGSSGKGKTTLINLISRFVPTKGLKGKILYNGEDIENYQLNNYYQRVLQVEQNTMLIEGTLEENLLLGDNYSKEILNEIIDICHLDNIISERGLEHYIEENGKNISGGEKQRIGLARILLRKPDLLILDEVTSALNEEIREDMIKKIMRYKEKYNLTIIIISHNYDFEKYSNKIYEL